MTQITKRCTSCGKHVERKVKDEVVVLAKSTTCAVIEKEGVTGATVVYCEECVESWRRPLKM